MWLPLSATSELTARQHISSQEPCPKITPWSSTYRPVSAPGFYGVVGNAIAHIHGSTMNTAYPNGFFNYHWVDDHICIAVDFGKTVWISNNPYIQR